MLSLIQLRDRAWDTEIRMWRSQIAALTTNGQLQQFMLFSRRALTEEEELLLKFDITV